MKLKTKYCDLSFHDVDGEILTQTGDVIVRERVANAPSEHAEPPVSRVHYNEHFRISDVEWDTASGSNVLVCVFLHKVHYFCLSCALTCDARG